MKDKNCMHSVVVMSVKKINEYNYVAASFKDLLMTTFWTTLSKAIMFNQPKL
jgi:hypothetical protein